jgi:hypothetical protein
MSVDTQFTYFRLGRREASSFRARRSHGRVRTSRSRKPHRFISWADHRFASCCVKSDEWMTDHNGNYRDGVDRTNGAQLDKVLTGLISKDPGSGRRVFLTAVRIVERRPSGAGGAPKQPFSPLAFCFNGKGSSGRCKR